MSRPPKNPGLDQELLDIVGGRSPGRQRKKPRKKSSPLGEALTALRVKSGFTQAELADACGVSLKFIRKVEQGGTSVNLAILLRLADYLGADLHLQERDG